MSTESVPEDQQPGPYRPNRAQWTFAGVILAFIAGVVLFKLLKGSGLGQTAALYIGIPAILALILTLSAPPKRALGMTMKVLTVFLLLSMPLLGEGFICVGLAAPLFYLVAGLVALSVDKARDRARDGGKPPTAQAFLLVPLALALLSFEGVIPGLSVPGDATVSTTSVVATSPAQVREALARPIDFQAHPPTGVLALGFPRPRSDGGGLDAGASRMIMFDGAHHRPPFMAAHHWGEENSHLMLAVTESGPDHVLFTAESDHTPIATWLSWRTIEISWRATDAGHTAVTWTARYTRNLAPSWYFGPIERFTVGRALEYLANAVDLPR